MENIPDENVMVPVIPKTLTLDVTLYEHYLENSPLSAQEKQELLQMLWNLICEFVFLGFGVSPVQQVIQDVHGQNGNWSATNFATELDLDQVESCPREFDKQGDAHD